MLAVLALAVLSGAGYAVKHGSAASGASSLISETSAVSGRLPSTPVTAASGAPSSLGTAGSGRSLSAGSVVLVGADLARLEAELVTATGFAVQTVRGGTPDVLAPGALRGVTGQPGAVVLEVVAGTRTSVRAATAIAAVKAAFPDARVLVIGPFSAKDRKSAAAVKGAAVAARATFLDPVDLHWRASDASATLSSADLHSVAMALAVALA
jgi:hypothetical protein